MTAAETFANQPSTTVSSGGTTAPSPGATETWLVASSSTFPAASTGVTQFHVADVATGKTGEIILVTNVSGTTWSVTRGAESTTPVAHTAGFTIVQVVTAGFLSTLGSGAGTVTSVTATDTSIVVSGTPTAAPTIATGTLDVIAGQHPPAGNWSNNSHKITSLANGSGAQDAAAFGQIPANLPLPVVTFTYGSSGAVPSSGTYTAGATAVDQDGIVRICTASGTPGTWARDGALSWQFWVDDYGATGNGKVVGDGAMTSSTATLTSASANFTSGDAGKNIVVNGGLGSSSSPLYTTILSVTNSTTVVLNANATNTVTNATVFYASDDSAAIVNAISAANTYAQANNWKCQLRFQAKSYGLATLTTTAASGSVAQQNALVPIPYPNVNGTTRKLIFEMIGVGTAADEQYLASAVSSITGTALVATVAATGTTPSIVGGPSASTGLTGTWANTKLNVRGVTVWAGWSPGWIGWDLHQLSACWIDNAGAQVLAANGGQSPGIGTIPSNTNGWGIIFPSNNDAGGGRIMVEGYYQAVGVSPRTTIEKLFTQAANAAIITRSVNGSTVHGARIGYWSCQICTTAIKAGGTSGNMPLVIDLMDCAGAITTDLSDANGTLQGSINWWADARAVPTVVSGFAMKITNLRVSPGPVASPASPPSSGSPSTGIFRDTRITLSISGGTLTALLIDAVDQHIPANCVLWEFALPSGHTYTPTYTGTLSTDVTVM